MAGGLGFPLRWSVVFVDLDPYEGSEQFGIRPVLVVSYERFHRVPLITICPITSARVEARYPNEVAIEAGEGGLRLAGVILCYHVRTISTRRIQWERTGTPPPLVTSPKVREGVRRALAAQVGLDIPAEIDGAEVPE